MNKLGFVAVSAIGISVVTLAAAAAIGLTSLSHGDWSFLGDDGEACVKSANTSSSSSREFEWGDSDSVTIEVPSDIHYARGQGTKVVVKGDPSVLDHLEIKDGKIEANCHMRHWRGNTLDITLPGREFRKFELEGMANLFLKDLAQKELVIDIAGKGEVTADGKVDDFKIDIAGKGDVHAKDLIVKTVKLDIAGRGDVETSPQDDANIDIAGSGDVKLYSEPKHIDTSIMGSGNVEHLAKKE